MKDKLVQFRLSQTEFKITKQLADQSGIGTISAYIRFILSREAKQAGLTSVKDAKKEK